MSQTSSTTIDDSEVAQFTALAETWWDTSGPFAPLHRINPTRLGWIRNTICQHMGRDPQEAKPLTGLRILDIGCGGGLVSEPLARMGADVTGIDAGEKNIQVARIHAEKTGTPVTYQAATAEALAETQKDGFDVVLALEIVEHVADMALFIQSCAALVRPGGMVIASTLNRTAKSWLFGIVGAEYILRWLPRGTHSWKKFVRPSEMAAAFRQNGLTVKGMTGLVFDPLRNEFRLDAQDMDVNYMVWAEKEF